MIGLLRVLEKLSIVAISVPIPSTNSILTRVRRKAAQVLGWEDPRLKKKISNLKRKIRQQASKHAQDVERCQKEIQELKLRERHHDIMFRDALQHIYHPYGNER